MLGSQWGLERCQPVKMSDVARKISLRISGGVSSIQIIFGYKPPSVLYQSWKIPI